MAAVTRQPFAPLNETRLQALTSLKNRQNAIPNSPAKRKAADTLDADDFENVDPVLFSKRSKGSDNLSPSKDSFIKPSSFILTKSVSSSDVPLATQPKPVVPRPRSVLNPKSPTNRINTSITKSSTPLSAPAGRSPTRSKRSGILSSRRRTNGAFSRVDPPSYGASSSTPFSLDAALKGTIATYGSRNGPLSASRSSSSSSLGLDDLHKGEMKESWFFDIHEDTPEQEMTNLLQHGTCVLDISSDEESESRRQRENAEGKENIPPVDDVSQTSRPRAARLVSDDEMVFEKERNPLGEMDVRDYYSEGLDANSIVIVPGDEDEEEQSQKQEAQQVAGDVPAEECVAVLQSVTEEAAKSVDELMQKTEEPVPCASLLEPMEGTGESFEVWESGSAKDEAETVTVEGTAC
ncbi:uncharacterized protein F4822DRAFT_394401 [Hypoxylon trugodes]|uniref:uncharacterized protein n=1 Tax=Hypoxylon trugodes TaxID=326681 RepID=UPI002199BF8A|nr:uncharacterized protein F4822DRAFT_394401 [Hypoxylon trugodes]KAI1390781.1 hypothetical protein F4822DRAFT_394401 [Hypoxylon trugodes]